MRFNGEMGWSSGCDHAEWAIVGCRRQNAEGELVYCFAVLPRSDYEIRDDWFAAGMRGSGTKTLVIKDAFVPNHRIQAAKQEALSNLSSVAAEAALAAAARLSGADLSPEAAAAAVDSVLKERA